MYLNLVLPDEKTSNIFFFFFKNSNVMIAGRGIYKKPTIKMKFVGLSKFLLIKGANTQGKTSKNNKYLIIFFSFSDGVLCISKKIIVCI
jgi:hypothetical protein